MLKSFAVPMANDADAPNFVRIKSKMNKKGISKMYDFKPPYYGAAYYPESWPREEIDADLDRLVSHGLNTVRIAEFAWSTMEPSEGKYDLSLFREVVDKCKARGISVVMCTPSATPPSWMAHKYPEIFVSDGDRRAHHGHRRDTCSTNKRFRRFCADIVEVMAREFANDENIIGWQIDNEFVTMKMGTGCNCPDCTEGFREFLRKRYGTVEELNDAWGHVTWSMNFTTFNEIDPMYSDKEQPAVHKYMWELYKTELFEDFCYQQASIIRKYTDKPIGTDMMPTQQFGIAKATSRLDVAQFNFYGEPIKMQFWLEAYRSQFDRPIWLTETSANWNGGNTPNAMRKKGFCKANTLMSFASGGEMALYWLFRSHRGGHEMAHGSVIDAWGRDMPSSPEVREISKMLDKLAPMVRSTRPKQSEIAISFGYMPYVMDKYASFETASLKYDYSKDIVKRIYLPLTNEHFRPDVIAPNHDLSPYKLLITHRHLTLDEDGFLDRIIPWIENGGTWVVGPYCDMFTSHLAKYKNAPFGHLEDWAKVTRAYYIPAPSDTVPGMTDGPLPEVTFADGKTAHTVFNLASDAIVAGEGVQTIATYTGGSEYLVGYSAITETKVGKGRIILMGTQLEPNAYRTFIKNIAEECGILPIAEATDTVFVNLFEGGYGTVLVAIETASQQGFITMPFDCVDIDTGEEFSKEQKVEMAPYRCIFAKRK